MERQIYNHNDSQINSVMPNLHNIFNQKQIVQSYNQRNNHQLIFQPHPRHPNANLNNNEMLIQHPQVEQYHKKPKRFAEDDLFGELHSHQIVENYSMLDEKDEPYDQYQNVFKGRGQKPVYLNQDMLASSSQNNEVPSRNSSLSSLSQKNQIINIKYNKSFMQDDLHHKGSRKNHVKSFLLQNRKNPQNHYMSGSQNQMDIQNLQNSPFQNNLNYHKNINAKRNIIKNEPSLFNEKGINNINMNINVNKNHSNNNLLQPQKKYFIPNFRRMDIDEEKQKQERLLKIQKIQQIGCNCKKSKCLKMYCQCFNLQIFCNQNCNCSSCCNQQSNQQHQKAVLQALTRNPKAFNQITQKLQSTFQLGVQLNQVKKGCKCKKTKCQKKYCECFNAGQACGKFCKCEGCQNC